MKLTKQAKQILNCQPDKDEFVSNAIISYSNFLLPVDDRLTLQSKELQRLLSENIQLKRDLHKANGKLEQQKKRNADNVAKYQSVIAAFDKTHRIKALKQEIAQLKAQYAQS